MTTAKTDKTRAGEIAGRLSYLASDTAEGRAIFGAAETEIAEALSAARREEREPDWRDALAEIAKRLVARLDGPPFDINGTPMSRASQWSHEIMLMRVALGLPLNVDAEEHRQEYEAILSAIRSHEGGG